MELIWSIDEDPFCHGKYDKEVRQSVDGDSETLEELLYRFNDKYNNPQSPDQNMVDLYTFLGFFTRRGQLRDRENFKMQKKDDESIQRLSDLISRISDPDDETKRYNLEKNFNRNLIDRKVDLVPKTGKGQYNVTVPQPFYATTREPPVSTQQIRFAEDMAERKKQE